MDPPGRQGLGGVKLKSLLRQHAAPGVLVALALIVLLVFIWQPGSPRGLDAWGHLFKAGYLAEEMHTRGLGAYLTSAWLPAWYLGDAYRTYYPPLTTLVLAPLLYLLGNPVVVSKLFASLVLIAFAALTYLLLNRLSGPWPAALGAILAIWAPYQLRTLFFEGNYPRALSLLALPLIAWLTERLLEGRTRRLSTVVLLGICWAGAILAHPQQAYMFAVGLAIYLVIRLFLDVDIPIARAAWWVGGVVVGAVLAAPWALPAYSGAEQPGIPYLPPVKVEAFAASLRSLLPSLQAGDGRVLFGFGAVVLAIIAAAARPDPRRTAYMLAGMAGLWLSLGAKGVAFNLLPLHDQLLPERFLNFAAFALAVAASGLAPFRGSGRMARSLVVAALLLVDLVPSLPLILGQPYPSEQAALAGLATGDGTQGRVALLTYPEPSGLEVYYAGQGSDTISGWALENTPHQVLLRRVLGAPAWGSAYLESLFGLWDVRTAVVRGEDDAAAARQALMAMGYRVDEVRGPYEIWRDATPSARVQRLPAQQMLAVGDGMAPFLAAFPFAEERNLLRGPEAALDGLESRPAVALHQFASSPAELEAVEARLRPFLEAGGLAIIDLSGMEGVVGRTLDFLGVHALRLSLTDRIPVIWSDSLAGLPSSLSLQNLPETGWSGATYPGLGTVLAEVEQDGELFPVLGYEDIGRGRAWFIGMNLLYYAQLTDNLALPETISDLVLAGEPVDRELRFQAVPLSAYQETSHGLSFEADMSEAGRVVVSYTYTPRWEVEVDGARVDFAAYQGLISFDLPAGIHGVEIRYRPYGTLWPVAGLAAGMLGALGCLVLIVVERRFSPLARAGGAKVEPDVSAYAPCAYCGFRMAEVRPPTPITYPFKVVSCAICGQRMDDEGFIPGKSLTPEEKASALGRWLSEHGYDPVRVHTRWGFTPDEFFAEPEAEEIGLPPAPGGAGTDVSRGVSGK